MLSAQSTSEIAARVRESLLTFERLTALWRRNDEEFHVRLEEVTEARMEVRAMLDARYEVLYESARHLSASIAAKSEVCQRLRSLLPRLI